MKRDLTEAEVAAYERLEGLAREIECAKDNLFRAALEAEIPDEAKIRIIQRLERAASTGLAYDLHVQHEWTGGDSMDADNFKATSPHIER